MKPIEIIATDLFEKVRSRFTNLQIGDESGSVTASPADARFFDFDFAVEGNVLGRVSISINEIGNLKIFYSQGIMENADSITQTMWYDFLKEMRFFAKRRLLSFDTRDITKGNLDKTDFQYLAQNGPKDNNMNESAMFGSSKTSHRKLENTDLIIRHSEAIDPTKPGARSRKIKNLFIQNEEGERFKFPFIYLPGARAMQRHVANGGLPYDKIGENIVKSCEEILKLSDFGRKVKHSTLNDNAHSIAEKAGQKLKQLRHHMESMSKQGYYESYKESYAPEGEMLELDDATMESYKDAFTQTKFDEALTDVFPILHRIMQEAGEVDLESYVGESQEDDEEPTIEEAGADDEFAAFESWTESIIGESFSDDELAALEPLMQEPLPIGANDEAVQALAGIGIKDPSLVKALRAQADMPNGADLDARATIQAYLGADATKISFGDLDAQPAPAAAPAPVVAPVEQPVAEAVSPAMQKLFDEWMSSEDAPYHRDAGDFNKIFSHALRFVTGKVSAEHADMAAEKLTNMFHGEEDDMQEGYNPNSVDAQHRRELEAHRRQEVEKKAAAGDENAKRWLERDDERKAAMRAEYDRRMERESVSNEGGIPGNVPTEKIPGKEDLLKGKGRSYYEGSYYGPEDFQDWLKDATHRVAQGRVSDWTELAAELSTELGMDDDKADRIAQRIYGHDKLAQYRVKPQDDLEKDIPSDSGEDDDAEFLNKLRSQARSGSIKQGADTGEKDESVSESPMNALQEVAQLVMGFYDRDNGTWTKGEHGVVTHVKRQFSDEEGNGGEREAELAAKLIQHLNAKHEATQQFEDIKKLAGLKIAEEKTVERDPKTGKVTSWKDEGEWKKSEKKDPRGKVTNLSDKARKETEKLTASSSKK
jgi:hypothetical protein